jgi:CubicO group peptidase (beta-lactamase class C family)
MKKKILISMLALLAFFITSCAENNVSSFTDAEQARIMQAVDDVMLTYNIPAVIVGVWEEGKISFEATINNYFPDITNADQITIRQVLGMTAGIYDFVNSAEFNELYYNDLTKVWTKEEILDLVNGQPADFAPGTSCKYSNTNFYLLGIIIEEITGNTAEEEIKTRTFDRLGLTNTYFPTDIYIPEEYCHGYNNIETGGKGILNDVSI